MKIKIFIERTNVKMEIDITNNSKVADLLKSLKINHTSVIVARNDELITEDIELKDNDDVKILSVISGG